jgi:serine protease AprX
MDETLRRTHVFAKWLVVALCAVLVFSSMGPAAEAKSYDPDKVDPLLASQALADPSGQFAVIVRMAARPGAGRERPARARDVIAQHGGTAGSALGIVGGAAATLSGRAVIALTRNPQVAYLFRDAPITAAFDPVADAKRVISPGVLLTYTNYAWSYYNVCGRGVGVAIVDSGVYAHPDLEGRIAVAVDATADPVIVSTTPLGDPGGHGTHVAGLVAGDGRSSAGAYTGTAPCAHIVDVRVLDAAGRSTTSTVLRGLQWVLANRATYGIRVVNLSFGAAVASTYRRDALSVAAEALVFSGVTVVAAAGNGGPTSETIVAPANDPFVLAVGALDDKGTSKPGDDVIPTFSARGPSKFDGVSKPDLVAPGRRVVSLLAPGSTIALQYPDRLVTATGATAPQYLRLSGTSMAAPLVSGIVALMLEKEPTLTTFQVRYRMTVGVRKLSKVAPFDAGAGLATAGPLWYTEYASYFTTNPIADALAEDLYSALYGQPLQWRSLGYNSGVDSTGQVWADVTWNNIAWDTISWENIAWERFAWDNIAWENIGWGNIAWEAFDGPTTEGLSTGVESLSWPLVD